MYTCELKLNDLLADPLVRMVMASDGVDETQIRTLARRIAPHKTLQDRLSEMSSMLSQVSPCRRGWENGGSVQPSA